jgi:hypothetical protein
VLRLGAQDAGADSPGAFDGVEVRGGTGSAPAGTPGAPGAPEPAQAGGDGELLVGSNAYAGGQPYAQAVAEQERKFGGLPILRTFHDGLPPDWPGDAGATDGPVVVSFKAEPEDVVEGVHDERLRDWFAGAPRDRDVHWTFFHEPENEVRQGHFTEAEFRDAWAHLDALAEEAGNERLHATLVLTCWTLQPASGRDWRDYYAGPEVVDVLAWDCYNTDAQRGTYRTPEQMFSAAAEAAEGEGKPWGIAEFGSSIAAGDDGTERAAWLTASVEWLRQRGARFVILFDAPIGGDFQVQDPASVRAWREAVEG